MDSSESRPSRRRLQGRLFTISPARALAGLTKAGFCFHFQYPAAKLHTLKNATHVNHADKQATGSSAEFGSPVPPTPALVVTSHQPLLLGARATCHVPRLQPIASFLASSYWLEARRFFYKTYVHQSGLACPIFLKIKKSEAS